MNRQNFVKTLLARSGQCLRHVSFHGKRKVAYDIKIYLEINSTICDKLILGSNNKKFLAKKNNGVTPFEYIYIKSKTH